MFSVSLSNSADFVPFKGLTLENIVSKEGRQPFPKLEFKISDLDPEECYQVSLSFRQHANKMKYIKNTWIPQYFSSCFDEEKQVMHEYGTATGERLMEKKIKFPLLKFTSDKSNVSATTIHLYNLHQYTPVLHIYPMKQNCLGGYEQQEPEEFTFEDADFVTVSRYVNRDVSKMKIKMNKYSSRFVEKRAGVQAEESDKKKKRRRLVRAETESTEQESAENAAQTSMFHVWNPDLPVTSNPYCVSFGNTSHSPAVHLNPSQYVQNYNLSFSYYSTSMSNHHQQPVANCYNQHLQQSNRYQGAFPAVPQDYQSPLQYQYPAPATFALEYPQHPSQMIGTAQLDYEALYYSNFY